MTTNWRNENTLIGRLQVRHSGKTDSLAVRLRLESQLSRTDLFPANLPPSAILYVRQLRDPLPGKLSLGEDGRPSLVWERAVKKELERLLNEAARPWYGLAPANAEAVIFSDQAELAACLALDRLNGLLALGWWWKYLPRDTDPVLATWLATPQYIPAALHLLATRQEVVRFVQQLNTRAIQALKESLLKWFALPELEAALASSPVTGYSGAAVQNESLISGTKIVTDEPGLFSRMAKANPAVNCPTSEVEAEQLYQKPDLDLSTTFRPAPWERWVPESREMEAVLNLEQQSFLGIGLLLQRAPAVVRAFAPALFEWRAGQYSSAPPEATAVASIPAKTTGLELESRDALTGQVDKLRESQKSDIVSPVFPHILPGLSKPPNKGHPQRALPDKEKAGFAPDTDDTGVRPEQPEPELTGLPPILNQDKNKAGLRGVPIETAYGGVFYLINLGLFLRLYGDFTTPKQPGIALPVWDFLALLGQSLVGEGIREDKIWLLLALLAGREEQEAPGQTFKPPEKWEIPPEWLRAFPEPGTWLWSYAEGRLRVDHSSGFPLLDLPQEELDLAGQLSRAVQVYQNLARFELVESEPTATQDFSSPLACWLSWLVPYVRTRLNRALGLDQDEHLPGLLCRHSARIFVTESHLDIVMPLAQLPLEIRRAGLDRDPGWVPAAGRYIAFHFE